VDDSEHLRQLEERLAKVKARMPRHTPRPSMMMEMEDLEEEIDALRARVSRGGGDAQSTP
jgi:hypothetical protein